LLDPLLNPTAVDFWRGNPAKAYEAGMNKRLVIIEFENVDEAIAAYESPEYQAALALLKNSAERDVRII
jgi:uncharacterized protein (DUF1330 family)